MPYETILSGVTDDLRPESLMKRLQGMMNIFEDYFLIKVDVRYPKGEIPEITKVDYADVFYWSCAERFFLFPFSEICGIVWVSLNQRSKTHAIYR